MKTKGIWPLFRAEQAARIPHRPDKSDLESFAGMFDFQMILPDRRSEFRGDTPDLKLQLFHQRVLRGQGFFAHRLAHQQMRLRFERSPQSNPPDMVRVKLLKSGDNEPDLAQAVMPQSMIKEVSRQRIPAIAEHQLANRGHGGRSGGLFGFFG